MKANILIVDDSGTIRFQVRQSFEEDSSGEFHISEAKDGELALRYLSACHCALLPHLIVLDRNMPNMTGDEFMQIVKTDQLWQHIPVLFLTAQGSISEIVSGLSNLQGDDYLIKPFDSDELLARAKVLLRIKFAEDKNRAMTEELQKSLILQKQAYEELKTTKVKLEETEAIAAMTETFQKFVPKQFLNRIAKEGLEHIHAGNVEEDQVTILFSDIRNFTTFSETMPANDLFHFLNDYLSQMTTVIEKHSGFIDKFIGDAIMALFDCSTADSTKTENAVKSAIEMQFQLNKYNAKHRSPYRKPINHGIGIHQGRVLLGTVGSESRMNSTVVGDPVNTASRLENLTKYYRSKIIISEEVFRLLDPEKYRYMRELDFVMVKGKDKPLAIYEIFANDPKDIRDHKLRNSEYHVAGLAQYRSRGWGEAIKLFAKCLENYADDYLSKLYIKRCRFYQKNPPPDTWDGSFKHLAK